MKSGAEFPSAFRCRNVGKRHSARLARLQTQCVPRNAGICCSYFPGDAASCLLAVSTTFSFIRPVRPTQTAFGRCWRTATNWVIAGERDRPGCRFRRRAKNPFPKLNGLTSSLIPAFSPRRRRNVRRRFEKPATGLAGPTFAKPASANGDFLSSGERIKGEGERQNQFSSPVRPSKTDSGSGGLPRPARPFSPARRRAVLAEGHHASGHLENSPAIMAGIRCPQTSKVPSGTKEPFCRPSRDFYIWWTPYPAINGWAIINDSCSTILGGFLRHAAGQVARPRVSNQ